MLRTLSSLRVRRALCGLLIVAAPFSLVPSIALPVANFPSFRLGIYQLLAALFVGVSLPSLSRYADRILKDRQMITGLLVIIVSIAIGMAFAVDGVRALIMGGSILFLLAVLASAYVLTKETGLKNAPKKLLNATLWGGIFYGFVSLIQLAIATFSPWNAGLCKGCTEAVFGFVRINGFAAEPLFWANALLPFVMAAFYLSVFKRGRLAYVALFFSTFAIGLTFARGAYVAVVAGILVYIIFTYVKKMHNLRSYVLPLFTMLVGGMLSWIIMIGAATFQYPDAPYITYNTFRGMAEHVSLGVVKLPVKSEPVLTEVVSSQEEFVSEGLVEASSNERLDSARVALDAWRYDVRTFLFGVGPGNLGPFAVENINSNLPANLTVYIYYVLVLCELGALGLFGLVLLFGSALKRTLGASRPIMILLGATLGSFAVQYVFFGSYINVIYIWLYLGLALAITVKKSTKQT